MSEGDEVRQAGEALESFRAQERAEKIKGDPDAEKDPTGLIEKLRQAQGDIGMEVIELSISDIRIRFLNEDGEPANPGEMIRCYNFLIEGPGIDTKRVKSVTIPKLDYSCPDLLTVMVEMFPFDPSDGRENNL